MGARAAAARQLRCSAAPTAPTGPGARTRTRTVPPLGFPAAARLQADIRRWPPGHPLSQQFPKRSLLPGAGGSAASREARPAPVGLRRRAEVGGDRRGLYQKSRGRGKGRANATLMGSWGPWKPAAPGHTLQPALGGRAGPPRGREERKGGSLLGKAPGQVSRSRKRTALETSRP